MKDKYFYVVEGDAWKKIFIINMPLLLVSHWIFYFTTKMFWWQEALLIGTFLNLISITLHFKATGVVK